MSTIRPANASAEALGAYIGGCANCGYDLRGLIEHRCPECGQAFDPTNSWPRRWIKWRADIMLRSLWALVGAAIISVLYAATTLPVMTSISALPGGTVLIAFMVMLGIAGVVSGIVAIAVTGAWMWREICAAVARAVDENEAHDEESRLYIPGEPPELRPPLNYIMGVAAMGLVMGLWLPGMIFCPYWLPPVALAMFWIEDRRTQSRLAGALLTPYAIDTRRQFAAYHGWGTVLSTIALTGWVGCFFTR